MPQRGVLLFGRIAGSVIYHFSGKRNRIAYSAMKAAFGDKYTPGELRALVKKVYRSMGETFIEILTITKVDKTYVDKYVRLDHPERLDEGGKNPGGMILLSAHFGNWELSTAVSALIGHPLHILARDQKMERLNELLNALRESKGSIVVRKGRDVRNIFRVLRAGGAVGILADQNAGANGIVLPFFNRPASIPVGAFRFAQKTGAVLIPSFIHRDSGPYHKIEVHEPMRIARGEDIIPYMERYNRILEDTIARHPDQWLWMHKKWKASPLRKTLILDDGKKGHLKQSLSLARAVRKAWMERGHESTDLEVTTVEVRYKGPLFRAFLKFWSLFFTRRCPGKLKMLGIALEKESFAALKKEYADIVLSTGSAMHPVSKIMAIENNCRNASVMAPPRIMRKWFQLIISPRHDDGREPGVYGRTVVTELAPNLIDEELFKDPENVNAASENGLGLLFGGSNSSLEFSENFALSFAGELAQLLDEGYLLRGTTSRRTGESTEGILISRLASHKNCVMMVKGSEDEDDRTVEKVLLGSHTVLVSGESVSMVSEAVSSSRNVIAFFPEGSQWQKSKYGKFVKRLQGKGCLEIADGPSAIPEKVRQMRHKSGALAELNDKELIDSAVKRLL